MADIEGLCKRLLEQQSWARTFSANEDSGSIDEAISTLRELEAEVGRLRGDNPETGDLWWDWDDGESSALDAGELAERRDLRVGEIMVATRALSLPTVWIANVVMTRDDDGDPDETEIKVFATEAEAKAAPGITPKPLGEREAIARLCALHGLGTVSGETPRNPPNSRWTKEEWERRILECMPKAVERQCYALTDAILALSASKDAALEAAERALKEAREIVGMVKPHLLRNRDRYGNALDKVSAFQTGAREALAQIQRAKGAALLPEEPNAS